MITHIGGLLRSNDLLALRTAHGERARRDLRVI
jgi:hypothetical protein